jgi:hypothetical protein
MERLTLALTLLIFTANAFALDKGTISGKVVEQVGALPVPAAIVQVYEASSEQSLITSRTDDDGSFKISNLKYGIYSIKVSYIGFVPLVVNDIILTEKVPEKRLGACRRHDDL